MGKLTVYYAAALFVIIAPVPYGASYVFHHGMMPPTAGN